MSDVSKMPDDGVTPVTIFGRTYHLRGDGEPGPGEKSHCAGSANIGSLPMKLLARLRPQGNGVPRTWSPAMVRAALLYISLCTFWRSRSGCWCRHGFVGSALTGRTMKFPGFSFDPIDTTVLL